VSSPFALGCALLLALATSSGSREPFPHELPLDKPAPDSFHVVFETTKGPFVVHARRAWSPRGVDRLYHLAEGGFYDGTVIFRVGPTASYKGGFVVQFGVANQKEVNAAWDSAGIPDEPVRVGHRRGRIYFARGGPGTRTTQLAVDLTANTPLDTVKYQGVVGFPAIGDVVEGMAVLDSLERRHGNAPMADWDSVEAFGTEFLDRKYPGLDRVVKARVRRGR